MSPRLPKPSPRNSTAAAGALRSVDAVDDDDGGDGSGPPPPPSAAVPLRRVFSTPQAGAAADRGVVRTRSSTTSPPSSAPSPPPRAASSSDRPAPGGGRRGGGTESPDFFPGGAWEEDGDGGEDDVGDPDEAEAAAARVGDDDDDADLLGLTWAVPMRRAVSTPSPRSTAVGTPSGTLPASTPLWPPPVDAAAGLRHRSPAGSRSASPRKPSRRNPFRRKGGGGAGGGGAPPPRPRSSSVSSSASPPSPSAPGAGAAIGGPMTGVGASSATPPSRSRVNVVGRSVVPFRRVASNPSAASPSGPYIGRATPHGFRTLSMTWSADEDTGDVDLDEEEEDLLAVVVDDDDDDEERRGDADLRRYLDDGGYGTECDEDAVLDDVLAVLSVSPPPRQRLRGAPSPINVVVGAPSPPTLPPPPPLPRRGRRRSTTETIQPISPGRSVPRTKSFTSSDDDISVGEHLSVPEERLAVLATELATPRRKKSAKDRRSRGAPEADKDGVGFRDSDAVVNASDSFVLDRDVVIAPNGSPDDLRDAEVGGLGNDGAAPTVTSTKPDAFDDEHETTTTAANNAEGGEGGFFARDDVRTVLHLSTFAIFGSSIRAFLARLFGGDCELSSSAPDDAFGRLVASRICVTASGRTRQTGGALFVDLPANAIGSFVMGIATGLSDERRWPPVPWLRPDHPLQRDAPFHVAIRAGLCGSLTTFASWNAQMVLMIDGTGTTIGRQVVSAMFGYVLGLQCAIGSYRFGRKVSLWMNRRRNPELAREADAADAGGGVKALDKPERAPPPPPPRQRGGEPRRILVWPTRLSRCVDGVRRRVHARTLPAVVLSSLLFLYVFADVVLGVRFYRTMWLSSLFAPPGALLRWRLSRWNPPPPSSPSDAERQRRRQRRPPWWCCQRPPPRWSDWIPIGTLAANVLGSVLASLLSGLQIRDAAERGRPPPPDDDDDVDSWSDHVLSAAKLGFAGSLSTVSTFVKEITDLEGHYPTHAKGLYYSTGTIVGCCLLGLCVYSPLARSG